MSVSGRSDYPRPHREIPAHYLAKSGWTASSLAPVPGTAPAGYASAPALGEDRGMRIIAGKVPDTLAGLDEPPDAVFIGGGCALNWYSLL